MVFGGYEADPVSRWEDGVPWDHAATLAAARLGAVRAADGRRHPPLPVPRRRRGDPPRLPPGRDDARREPAARAAARRPRVLGRRGAVAQRLRWRRRDRPGDRRLDHGRRSGRRHRAVSGLAVRRHLPRPGVRGRPGARDLRRLLPAALPVRRRRGRPAAPAVARSTAGSRRPARSSARRPAGSGPTSTSRAGRGAASGATRPPTAGRGRRGSSACWRGAPGGPRAGRDHRPELVRQDRGRGPGRARRCSSGSAPTTSTARSAAVDLHASCCDERGGIVADVTVTRLGRRPLPGRDRRRLPGVGDWPGCAATSPTTTDRSRSATTATSWTTIGLWGPRGARRPRRPRPTTPSTTRRSRSGRRAAIRVGPAPGPGVADQLRRRARLGARRSTPTGRSAVWDRARRRPARRTASSRSATGRSTRSGWRRATATSART